jgi:hypothetical protein
MKNVQVGDIVFNRKPPYHKVTLLEKPLDASEFVSCQAPNGSDIRVQACHLSRISKGTYSGDFFHKSLSRTRVFCYYFINLSLEQDFDISSYV